jgi:dephospho-CoA kinase
MTSKQFCIIGLTGGIGSGKSFVAKEFEKRGFPVYYADDEAKKIMIEEPVKSQISTLFGNDVYDPYGNLNRGLLSRLVFNDSVKLEALNKIVHPAVAKHFEEWVKENKNHKFVFKEAAILFETGSNQNCDYIILITAPEALRIQRVVQRDGSSEDEIRSRMNKQWSDEMKIPLSDFVIENINADETVKKVNEIVHFLKNK